MCWLPRKKVLVPTDFSDASADAMHTALAMVEYGHCVHALHVVEPIPEDLAAGDLSEDSQILNLHDALLLVRQEHLDAFLTDHEFNGLSSAIRTGDPALCITRYAKENDIDLIVMAARGYENGERISMGSVTERVLHNADCPVLVLRPDGRVSGTTSRAGIRESNGFAPAESHTGAGAGAGAGAASQPR